MPLQSSSALPYITAMDSQPRFSISPRAVARITEILAGDPDAASLRVAVLAGGCSGFSYKFELAGAPQSDDLVIDEAGARVLIDPVSLDLLAGAELDYADKLMGAHFTVRNPNATAGCGCGTSFSID